MQFLISPAFTGFIVLPNGNVQLPNGQIINPTPQIVGQAATPVNVGTITFVNPFDLFTGFNECPENIQWRYRHPWHLDFQDEL